MQMATKLVPTKERGSAETLEAFKECVHQILRRLPEEKRKIARVHSDQEKSILGAELHRYIQDQRWWQTTTEGYDHNKNARIENRNKKVRRMMRAAMRTATGASHYAKDIWDEIARHASNTVLLNLWIWRHRAMYQEQSVFTTRRRSVERVAPVEWDDAAKCHRVGPTVERSTVMVDDDCMIVDELIDRFSTAAAPNEVYELKSIRIPNSLEGVRQRGQHLGACVSSCGPAHGQTQARGQCGRLDEGIRARTAKSIGGSFSTRK